MTRTPAQASSPPLSLTEAEEQVLRGLASGDFYQLRSFPAAIETAFHTHSRSNTAALLRQSVYLLAAIYLLVCLPISILSNDPNLRLWQSMAMAPIGLVLGFIWLTTRFNRMDAHVEKTLAVCLCVSLTGTIFCSMLLGDVYFGRISSYETIYILVIAFSILRLPTLLALGSSLLAFAIALAAVLTQDTPLVWFDMLLYFGVPVIICTVNGYMLEFSERRNYVQNLLINMESQRLMQMRRRAEGDAELQEKNGRFLEMIAGNLSVQEIASRALSFFVTETGAMVGTAYRVEAKGRLRLIGHWGGDVNRLRSRQLLEPAQTLLGPALKTRQILQVTQMPPDYLPISSGSGQYRPAAILMIPVHYSSSVVGAMELGALHEFSGEHIDLVRTVTTHLAYAMMAAMARSDDEMEAAIPDLVAMHED